MNQYPRIYFRAMDELLNQDYCCIQMLLTLPHKFDYLLSEFGLDGKLQRFNQNLIEGNVTAHIVDKNLDIDKLRVEVTLLLKLLIQVCITELPFLKQLYSRKEEKAEEKSPIPTPGLKFAKELW